ncbi:hypothetical protein SDC9_126622 [bioreactor metagenome]|uniref:Uncharacterized protein n=1 Tax=bioreactor metagenome TaxID=1076179 RepID=A0A645CRP7_9ZZZZ
MQSQGRFSKEEEEKPDHVCHHRRVVKIGEGQVVRVVCVVGILAHQPHECNCKDPQHGKDRNHNEELPLF